MRRILVADDDPVQLDVRKTVLEAAGYEVAVAFSGHETMQQMEAGWANLLIMDLRFLNAAGEPDSREGLGLIRSIRERGWQTPVLVLSGWPEDLYGQPEERMVSKVMIKPVHTRELLEAIDALAQGQ